MDREQSLPKRNALDSFAVSLASLMIKLRWLVVLLAIIIAGAVGTGMPKLAYDNNYRTFFSDDNPELKNFEEFQATYTKNDNFLMVIVPKETTDVFNNETLALLHFITEEGWQTPYASRVDSLTNFQYTYAIEDDLIVEDLIGNPGESSAEELARKKAAALSEPLLVNQLVTQDASATAINIVLQYPEKDLGEVPEAVAFAREVRAKALEQYPNHEIYLSGTSMLSNAFSEAIQSDFSSLIPAMILIILVTTAIAVRSVSATLSTLFLVILSVIVGMGWAGHVGIKLAGPSPSAVIVILTLAIADSIHILISARGAMRGGMNKRDGIVEAIRVNFLAVSITSVTTIIGFMALNFSDSPPFRDLGNISAVGIFAAWMFSLTLLPALLSIIPFNVKPKPTVENKKTFLTGFADLVIGNYRVLFFGIGFVSLGLIAMIPRNELSDEFRKYFTEKIEFRRDADKAVNHFGFYPVEFSVKAGAPGDVSDPKFLAKLEDFSNWLREQRNVTHVYSIADIMKRLNKNLNGDDPAFYRLPDDRELSAQYLLLFELSLPYGLDLNDRINIDKSATRVTATFDGDTSSKRMRAFLKEADAWYAANAPEFEAPATGAQIMFTFIAERNVNSMVRGTVLAVVFIALIMMLALRSVSMGLISMVPNGLPILSAFGVWSFLVGEVGFAVAAVASISLGIVIDDTVHFLTKYTRARNEKGLSTANSIRYAFETVGVAIIINTIILSAGFLILTLSAFKINFELGLLTALSIGLALILDFLFLPALLMMFSKDKNADITPETQTIGTAQPA
ncbi:MAG: MMPL family transporter [Pseudomonadota bacterium]